MAKEKRAPGGRKIKQSQPIALAREFRDTLEEFQVIKGPVVPKFEVLDKYIVGRGWKLSLRDGHGTDPGSYASVGIPGLDGPVTYEATGETAMHAATYALCEALRNEPKQAELFDERAKAHADPNGADLPMFRGNGGVAGPIGVNVSQIADEVMGLVDAELERDPYGPPHGRGNPEDQAAFVAAANADDEDEQVNPWTFLYQLNPTDMKAWKEAAPVDGEGTPIVEWEDGDELNDRGFYLDPGFHYDHKAGEIRLKKPDGDAGELVWSRDVAPKAAKKTAKPQVSNVTPEQADALAAAGAASHAR